MKNFYCRARERAYELLEVAAPGDLAGRLLNLAIIALVLLNALAFGLEFVEYFRPYGGYLRLFEVFSVAFFSVEYLLRLWSATSSSAYRHALGGRLRFALRPLMLVDLLAVLPFYLPFLVSVDLRIVRLLRLARLLRLFKLSRYLRQKPIDQTSLDELLNQFQRHMASLRARLSQGRDQDLALIRQAIDHAVATIRRAQQTWLAQRWRSAAEKTWEETRQSLLAPLKDLEAALIDQARIHQSQELVRASYSQAAALFDQAPEWAILTVELGWKNIRSFTRVPARRLGQRHFQGLAALDQAAFSRFRRTCVDEARRRLDSVRTALDYVLDLAEEQGRALALPQEVQVGLNRAVNRLLDLSDPARSAWEGLLWELEDEQQRRMELVRADVARYGSLMFYLGRLGRWLRGFFLHLLDRGRALLTRLLPLVRQRLVEAHSYIYGHLKPLLQWIGLVKPQVLEVMQTLDEAALNSVQQRGLPEDYLRHFTFDPLADEDLFVGFDEELAIVDQAIRRWERALSSSFIVHGQRGAGKTTLINIARQRLFDQDQPVAHDLIGRKITTADELVAYLAGLLDLGGAHSFEALAQALLQGPRRAVILEGCHNLFLRRIGGLEAVRHLLWLIARTNYHVLWGLCLDRYAHRYLGKSLPLDRLFHFEVAIQDWKPHALRQLVMRRHDQSGYNLRYAFDKSLEKDLRRRVRHWRRIDEPAVQEALEQFFFEGLVETAGENIMVALYYWLRSLEPAGKDRYSVAPMKELDLSLIYSFSLDQAFILAAVLQHDNLTAEEVAQILDASPIQTRLELEILDNQNILEFSLETGRYRVNPVALKAVNRMLEGRNLIY